MDFKEIKAVNPKGDQLSIFIAKMDAKAPKSLQMVIADVKLKDACSLEKKTMTSLNSVLKYRDITLPTKVHMVKAMVFPVVMYGCESWTIKKAER